MTDMNFMDVFFGGGNTVSHLEKDSRLERKDEEQLDWISDDFLDSILKSCTEGSNPLLDQFLTNENDPANSFMECSSDSGLSHEPDCSPVRSVRSEDDFLIDPTLETDSLVPDSECLLVKNDDKQNNESTVTTTTQSFESVEYIKEEEVEFNEVYEPIYIIDSDSLDGEHDTFVVQQIDPSDDDTNLSFANFSSDNSISSPKDEFCEVVNAVPRSRNKRLKTRNYSSIQRLQNKRRKFSDVSEGTTSDDSDSIYPRLHLTPEEQKLAVKEGIKLPSHHPLTKSEERELKRIRRKIRNKLSAQDSRRRKKEYVDGLEERAKRTSEENANLMERIKTLENQKITLVAQVRKLQAALARCSGQTAQPSTCLLVLVMSLALILAPNLRNTPVSSDSTDDEGISLSEDGSSSYGDRPNSRNLLFSQKNIEGLSNLNEETAKMLTEQLEKMQMADGNVLTSALEMLKFVKSDSSLKEHDYFRPRKRFAGDIGEGQLASSKMYAKVMSDLKNMASSFGIAEKKKAERLNSVEPIVIDLSD